MHNIDHVIDDHLQAPVNVVKQLTLMNKEMWLIMSKSCPECNGIVNLLQQAAANFLLGGRLL